MTRLRDSSESGKLTEAGRHGDGGLKEKVGEVGQDIRELGQQARTVATEKFEDLRGQAKEYYEQGREKATQWEQSIEDYVREKPLQSVLIAAGVGIVLGMLWKRS